MSRQYHLALAPGEVGRYVLLPGDPGRVARIAAHLERARPVASNREYVTYTGLLGGEPVSVTSTGIGGPSAAIAVEELYKVGARVFVRVGTCGALQPTLQQGDLIVASGAVRDEGTTAQYVPCGFPALASAEVVGALSDACREAGQRAHVGLVQSKDSFYGELEGERMPVAGELQSRLEAFKRAGVLASEMECSTIFIVAQILGARAGALTLVTNVQEKGMGDMSTDRLADQEPLLRCAVEAVARLIAGRDGR